MDLLRIRIINAILIFLFSLNLFSCGNGKYVVEIPLEIDTYIRKDDLKNHSKEGLVEVVNTASEESRGLVKIPSGKRGDGNTDDEKIFKEIFSNPISAAIVLPFYIIGKVLLALILGCSETDLTLDSSKLDKAEIRVDVAENSANLDLNNAYQLNLVSQPWHPRATWTRRHSFTKASSWTAEGGDKSSEVSVASVQTGGTDQTVSFPITDYFKTLLDNQEKSHYGFLIEANSTMPSVKFLSSNGTATSTVKRPRVYSEYTVCTPSHSTSLKNEKGYTYYLDAADNFK